MTDNEWLAKVRVAYAEYSRQYPSAAPDAEMFVRWLHQQYGIIYKEREHSGQIQT